MRKKQKKYQCEVCFKVGTLEEMKKDHLHPGHAYEFRLLGVKIKEETKHE